MTIIIDGTVGANKAVVLDSSGKLPAIDGSLVTTLNATQVTTGSIATARLDTGTTTGKVLVLDGSGNMPAIAAGAMTGVSSATKSSSDPTVSTNPSTGLGTKWINTTSGEIYILTDATAGANVWTSTGGTSGDVVPWFYGGTQYGYSAGGYPSNDLIDKFSFTSDGNASDIGNLTIARHAVCGNSSKTYGFACGGSPTMNTIDKYSFSVDGNAVDHGDLSVARTYPTEPGSSSSTHGYTAGGSSGNVIDKFLFASNSNASDVGNLTSGRGSSYGHSSTTHGYAAHNAIIDKWAFASDGDAADVGALSTSAAQAGAGTSSATYGYSSGAEPYSGAHGNVIDKYSFASAGTATDVGNLVAGRGNCVGQSSTTYGYTSGGDGGGNHDIIDKFSFTADGNATDVGNLITARGYMGGSHY